MRRKNRSEGMEEWLTPTELARLITSMHTVREKLDKIYGFHLVEVLARPAYYTDEPKDKLRVFVPGWYIDHMGDRLVVGRVIDNLKDPEPPSAAEIKKPIGFGHQEDAKQ